MIKALVIDPHCRGLELGSIHEAESFKNFDIRLKGKNNKYHPTQFIFYEDNKRIWQTEVKKRLKIRL